MSRFSPAGDWNTSSKHRRSRSSLRQRCSCCSYSRSLVSSASVLATAAKAFSCCAMRSHSVRRRFSCSSSALRQRFFCTCRSEKWCVNALLIFTYSTSAPVAFFASSAACACLARYTASSRSTRIRASIFSDSRSWPAVASSCSWCWSSSFLSSARIASRCASISARSRPFSSRSSSVSFCASPTCCCSNVIPARISGESCSSTTCSRRRLSSTLRAEIVLSRDSTSASVSLYNLSLSSILSCIVRISAACASFSFFISSSIAATRSEDAASLLPSTCICSPPGTATPPSPDCSCFSCSCVCGGCVCCCCACCCCACWGWSCWRIWDVTAGAKKGLCDTLRGGLWLYVFTGGDGW
eukprot:comp21103_c0_seq1/m.44546 comp21103_c0_seq1/g.44546  ORF comp21103_c0_seq1/g.44546 comp21103_c0_seq1/m.44546 type:complete len:355 (-) comp21103_c0_seq1:39-1103(-)